MASINVYLHFDGRCEAAFGFYRSVLGGEFTTLSRFGDLPPGSPMHGAQPEHILHVSLPVGGSVLQGSDRPSGMGSSTVGDNYNIVLNLDSRAETDRVWAALGEGGRVRMPLADTFWGAYFGMLTDRFGIHWMLNCEAK